MGRPTIWSAFVVAVFGLSLIELEVRSQFPPTFSYFVTIRSFMASTCRNFSSTEDNLKSYCPSDPATLSGVRSGIYSGHPDFERKVSPMLYTPKTSAVHKYNGKFAQFGRQFPLTATNDNGTVVYPYVLSTLKYDSTGIGKMQYCQGEEGYACDFNDSSRTVMSKESFSTWYSDSTTYNKRIGYKQPLYRVTEGSGQYQFNSGDSVQNPQQNPAGIGLFDPISLYGLSHQAWAMSPIETGGATSGDKNHGCALSSPLISGCRSGKYWFTTEIHTNFQYQGGEVFSFFGDDDVHIFLNGRLAINLGGEHSQVFATIDLDTYAPELNITKGNVYSFDMFHVERQTVGSNFKITTTLSESCNVVTSDFRSNGTDVQLGIDWRSGGGTDNADWFLLGGQNFGVFSQPLSAYYTTLMAPGVMNVASYMFHRSQQNIGSGFSLNFNFKMAGNGHGFAAVVTARSLGLRNFNGGIGPNLGIKNLDRSFAIVFDQCPNFPDCSQGQRLSLHYSKNGTGILSNTDGTRSVNDANVIQNWRDGAAHSVQVFYYAVPNWLEVYVDDSLRLVERDFDLQEIVGGRNAFVGFTSASSDFGSGMKVEIGQVQVKTVKVAPRYSQLVNTTLPSKLVADGKQAVQVLVQSQDACSNPLRYGGLATLAQGRAVYKVNATAFNATAHSLRRLQTIGDNTTAITVVESADVIDNLNGTYAIAFRTQTIGSASLFVAFGPACVWNGTYFIPQPLQGECWTMQVPSNLSSVSPPPSPEPEPGNDPNSLGFPWYIVYTVAGCLGGAIVCCCCLAFALMRYRRKWRKDKKFVKPGQQAVLDRDVEMSNNPLGERLMQLSRRLQDSTMEILKLKAVVGKGDENMATKAEVDAMKEQTDRLKEEVKGVKRRHMENNLVELTGSKRTLARESLGSTSRINFAPEIIDKGSMPSAEELEMLARLPPPQPDFIAPVFVPRNSPKASFLVSVSKRDVDLMISTANDHASVLTGGEIFGQVYENGDCQVMNCTSPGYSAKMERDSFVQSPAFVNEATLFLSQHSAFRIGSWVSTSVHSKPVSELLKQTLVSTAPQMEGAKYVYILLVQLCGIKNDRMIVTISPFRYPVVGGATAKSEVGDLYVFEDIDPEANKRHQALDVLRSRPPPQVVMPSISSTPPLGLEPQKKRFAPTEASGPSPSTPPPPGLGKTPPQLPPSRGSQPLVRSHVSPPPPPPSRPIGTQAPMPPPPRPPGLGAPNQTESAMMILTPRRLSIAEDDENPLVPVIMDGTIGDTGQPTKKRGFFSSRG